MRRLTSVLAAFLLALAAMLPGAGQAMPTAAGMMAAGIGGTAMLRPCTTCPSHAGVDPVQHGTAACPILACTGTLAVLTPPALLPAPILPKIAYSGPRPAQWRTASPAPDPLPPRAIALL